MRDLIVNLENANRLDNRLFEEGKIKPLVDGPYQLSEVPKALRYFGEGKHQGK